jgi:PhzF family phenazine biosynthesis protein
MVRTVAFCFVDVFATRPLTGNPLSLVPDADGLDASQMQAIAREFNQSETTFLVRPTRPGATWRLRSFTPAGVEVGGAGHNAMGAWLWLASAGRLPDPAGGGAGRGHPAPRAAGHGDHGAVGA